MKRLIGAAARAGAVLSLTLPLALGGCSDTIQYEGKIFDALGMSEAGKKRQDHHVSERAPLVLPPNANALPPPGSVAANEQNMNWPDDPDRRRAALAAEEKKKRKFDPNKAIQGQPQPGLLDRLYKGQNQEEAGAVADVPEPESASR